MGHFRVMQVRWKKPRNRLSTWSSGTEALPKLFLFCSRKYPRCGVLWPVFLKLAGRVGCAAVGAPASHRRRLADAAAAADGQLRPSRLEPQTARLPQHKLDGSPSSAYTWLNSSRSLRLIHWWTTFREQTRSTSAERRSRGRRSSRSIDTFHFSGTTALTAEDRIDASCETLGQLRPHPTRIRRMAPACSWPKRAVPKEPAE